MRRWKIRGIQYLLVMASGDIKQKIKDIRETLTQNGIGIIILPDNLAHTDYTVLMNIHQILRSKLRTGSAEIIFDSSYENEADNFLKGFSIYNEFLNASDGKFIEKINADQNRYLSNYTVFLKSAVRDGLFLAPHESPPQVQIVGQENAKEDESVKSDSSKNGKKFTPSKVTIKIKMMAMISMIILTALSVVIFLASNFFKDVSERRVQEANLNLTEIIGQRIEIEISTIQLNAKTFAANILREDVSGIKGSELSDLFFNSNKDYIFIGIAKNDNGIPVFIKQFINESFLFTNEIPSTEIINLHALNSETYMQSFSGAVVVHNASPGFKIPLISIIMPYNENIIIVYLDPKSFLKTFKTAGITTTYMVDDKGFVIAHPESEVVLTKSSYLELPIVQKMLQSQNPNGQIKYQDKNKISYLGSFKRLDVASLGIISTVPEKKALQEVYDIQRRNIYIMALVLNAALLIVFFYARSLSIPLIRLVGATKKIEEGDYLFDLKPSSRDEVGILTNSFVTMAKGLGEREKMKDALGKFVNKQIAEKVLSGDLTLGGEGKHCAIFFSDLRNFTAMSEGMTPQEVVGYLNLYFTRMVDCVNKTNGTVDKFIGDAIMAHWGALEPTGNDTENAVNSALMMRKSLLEFNMDASEKKPAAKYGCGINTGDVVSGQIGSDERLEYTVIGDAVNLASRIEALNKPFGTDILISQDSYEHVSDIFKVEKMPSIKVKGKSEPQTIYAVLGRFDDPECPSSLSEVRRIVGIVFDESKSKNGVFEEEKEVKYEVLEK